MCRREGGEADWIGHILLRNSLLKHIIEGRTEGCIGVTDKQRRRRRKLLDDLKV